MKRTLAILVIACIALAGCRSGGRKDLLTRDLRLQEDRIYELEDMVDEMECQLESCRRENATLKKELGGAATGGSSSADSSITTPAVEVPPGISGPSKPEPGRLRQRLLNPRDNTPKLEPPKIELGPGVDAPPELQRLPSGDGPSTMDGSFIPHTQPVKIVMNRRLTGGLKQDGSPGDAGILVAFEPRDAQGRLAIAPGDVSIVVLDPSKKGAASRVARWDFTADEALTHFQKSPLGDGLQFELPWPSDPPTGHDLRLYVRYGTPEHKYLTADAHIGVESTHVAGAGWTEAAPKPLVAASVPAAPQLVSHEAPAEKVEPVRTAAVPVAAPPREDRTEEDAADAREKSIREKPVWKPYR